MHSSIRSSAFLRTGAMECGNQKSKTATVINIYSIPNIFLLFWQIPTYQLTLQSSGISADTRDSYTVGRRWIWLSCAVQQPQHYQHSKVFEWCCENPRRQSRAMIHHWEKQHERDVILVDAHLWYNAPIENSLFDLLCSIQICGPTQTGTHVQMPHAKLLDLATAFWVFSSYLSKCVSYLEALLFWEKAIRDNRHTKRRYILIHQPASSRTKHNYFAHRI